MNNVVPLRIEPESLAYLDKEYAIIDYVEGELVTGKKIWAYLGFKPSAYMRFAQKKKGGENIFLLDYGDVIMGGHGERPKNPETSDIETRINADVKISNDLKAKIDQAVYGR